MIEQTPASVCLLGTKGGPAIRPGSTNPTSSLLQLDGHDIVIDCGLGVTRALVDQGLSLVSLSRIFITHLHSDHYLELGPLLHTAWTAGLKTPVDVHAPAGMQRYWDNFVQTMADDIELRIADEGRVDLHSLVRFHVLDDGVVWQDDTVSVSALRNRHPPLVDTFALSFRGRQAHVVFSGDTAFMPELAELARGADLLIHEAMLEQALPALFARIGNSDDRLHRHWMQSHTLAGDAGRLANMAGVKALALHHLIPSDDPDYDDAHWQQALEDCWSGPLYIGRDGMRITL